MTEYVESVHGNAVRIENPEHLKDSRTFGWGLTATFAAPAPQPSPVGTVIASSGPGCWLHAPLASRRTLGRSRPMLRSVTLRFATSRCAITAVHIYDGARLVCAAPRPDAPLGRLTHPDAIKAWTYVIPPLSTLATGVLVPEPVPSKERHRLVSAIGVSFFVNWDLFWDFHGLDRSQPLPDPVLTVSAVGATFEVDDTLRVTTTVSRGRVVTAVDRP
jgi:hypothetical protein